MVHQEPFLVEQYMDRYENDISYNMGETCVESLSMNDIAALSGDTTIPPKVKEAVLATKLTYGHITGSPDLKGAVAAIYNDFDGSDISRDHILITNGAIGANFLLFYALVGHGDSVVTVCPSYQQLLSVPEAFSQRKCYKFDLLKEDAYQPDLERLDKLIAQCSAKLLVINNPNNPTGAVWEDETLQKVVDICKKYGTYILGDEVYRPLFHTVKAPKSIVNFGYDRIVSTGSTSKAFSLAGLRLGWVVSRNKALMDTLASRRDYNTISVSRVDDALTTYALTNYKPILERNRAICAVNLALLDAFVAESAGLVSWVRPRAGSTCYVSVKTDTNALAVSLAEKDRVLVVPSEAFDKTKGKLRIGFGNLTEDLKMGLKLLKQRLADVGAWKGS